MFLAVFFRGFATHNNSVSILQQHYNRLPIRKKFIKAIKRGTLVWDKGQVKIPPLLCEGYDPPKHCILPNEKNRRKQYRGRFENLQSKREKVNVPDIGEDGRPKFREINFKGKMIPVTQ